MYLKTIRESINEEVNMGIQNKVRKYFENRGWHAFHLKPDGTNTYWNDEDSKCNLQSITVDKEGKIISHKGPGDVPKEIVNAIAKIVNKN